MIELKNISKNYKSDIWGLKDVNLTINNGVFGLLGPNGAGKTTLMRILSTLIKPTDGRCFVGGVDILKKPNKIRNLIGYLPQDFSLYPNLTVFEFVSYMGKLKGIKNKKSIDEVIEEVGLSEVKKRKISDLSGGMKRRVGIAQAIIGEPQIIIVDEPTAGLDPEERVRFRSLISKLAKNRMVILSTHNIEDIYQTCKNIGILKHGEVVFEGDKQDLINQVKGLVKEIKVNEIELEKLRKDSNIVSVNYEDDGILVRLIDRKNQYNDSVDNENLLDAYVYKVGEFK